MNEPEDVFLAVVRLLTKVSKDARRRILRALFAFFEEDLP